MTSQNNQSVLLSERINVRCPQCHKILCTRRRTGDGWVLYFRAKRKRKTTRIYAEEFVLQCGECGTLHRITSENGITESYKSEDYGKRTQGQGADTEHIVESVTTC